LIERLEDDVAGGADDSVDRPGGLEQGSDRVRRRDVHDVLAGRSTAGQHVVPLGKTLDSGPANGPAAADHQNLHRTLRLAPLVSLGPHPHRAPGGPTIPSLRVSTALVNPSFEGIDGARAGGSLRAWWRPPSTSRCAAR